ncbi:uncharacterized protein LOC144772708 isoform X3 [Lissotriton helveticus]
MARAFILLSKRLWAPTCASRKKIDSGILEEAAPDGPKSQVEENKRAATAEKIKKLQLQLRKKEQQIQQILCESAKREAFLTVAENKVQELQRELMERKFYSRMVEEVCEQSRSLKMRMSEEMSSLRQELQNAQNYYEQATAQSPEEVPAWDETRRLYIVLNN